MFIFTRAIKVYDDANDEKGKYDSNSKTNRKTSSLLKKILSFTLR